MIKKVVLKIKYNVEKIVLLIKTVYRIILPKKKIYILGVPLHGNIGDQAIIYAEKIFLKENFKKYKIVEIESTNVKRIINFLKKNIKTDDILTVHGGGFIGSLWINEEIMFRCVVENFKENNIIVFPQTVYFSNDEYGKSILKDSKKSYGETSNLTIACREKYSYDFIKEEFPNINVILVPDIVLYLNKYKFKIPRNDVLFCIRSDKEKIDYNYTNIEKVLREKYKMKIDYTDTVISKSIYEFKREKIFLNKLKQISKYKLMVTDRLHGMIFAYLTNTPCIVFENKSYKVRGVYEWIKNSKSLMLVSNSTSLEEINSFIEKNINGSIADFSIEKETFEPLVECLSKKEYDAI